MAKLPEDIYTISIGNNEYLVSRGFAELLSTLLREGEISDVVLTTKTDIRIEKMKLSGRIFRLSTENKRLKEELQLVREDNDKFTEDIKQVVKEKNALETKLIEVNKKLLNSIYGKDSAEWNELVAENRRLQEKQAFLESQIDILSTTCDGYMDNINEYKNDVKQLTRENKKLIEERDALWAETQHLDKMYKQLLNEKKRLQENFEELKASSDLSMTAELAEIFAEFIDKHDKNRDDLSVKIDEFREKYQSE